MTQYQLFWRETEIDSARGIMAWVFLQLFHSAAFLSKSRKVSFHRVAI